MEQQELIPHLFRKEFGKIAAVLCKQFGIGHMEAAEDIAGDTFLAALEIWPYKGIPANPVAWLYTVAQNKTRNYLKRNLAFREKIAPHFTKEIPADTLMIDLSDTHISDSQLQMLFAICHPSLPAEAQVALSLRILCGLGTDEIASAFLTGKDTISKRLYRAKEKLRTEKVLIVMPPLNELPERLQTVLTTLYLLFSEGYYSENNDQLIRSDLCTDAIRLTSLLTTNPVTNLPEVNALLALMCFHASRLDARKSAAGAIVLYDDQDEKLWNNELIAEGARYFHASATGNRFSKYHLEAGIAYWHTIKKDSPEKWENILHLYNLLLAMEYSPVAALNRTFALSKVNGKAAAISEAEKLQLTGNPFYYCLLGELYSDFDKSKSKENYQQALLLAGTKADKDIIAAKLERNS
jgi:RNA polymerase sigma-70 factor (ECF subfamily)